MTNQYDWIGSDPNMNKITLSGPASLSNGPIYTISSNTQPVYTINSTVGAGLDVKGDAIFGGDIKIKGKSLIDTLNKIEERLAILNPNAALEENWAELKELGNRYRALEKELIKKQEVWEILKR